VRYKIYKIRHSTDVTWKRGIVGEDGRLLYSTYSKDGEWKRWEGYPKVEGFFKEYLGDISEGELMLELL